MNHEGIYSMIYDGMPGAIGMGMILLETGRVTGADIDSGRYDGTYRYNERTGMLDAELEAVFPAGTRLVSHAAPLAQEARFPLRVALPVNLGGQNVLPFSLPGIGQVRVVFKKLRSMPD